MAMPNYAATYQIHKDHLLDISFASASCSQINVLNLSIAKKKSLANSNNIAIFGERVLPKQHQNKQRY